MAFYRDANGPSWVRGTGWLEGPMDGWDGVTTVRDADGYNRVSVLDVGYQKDEERSGVFGQQIPSAVTRLTSLEVLDLTGSHWYYDPEALAPLAHGERSLSAAPRGLMDIPGLDSIVGLGANVCVPHGDAEFDAWLLAREWIRYWSDVSQVPRPYDRAMCPGTDSYVDSVAVAAVQVTMLDEGRKLVSGRDAWLLVKPYAPLDASQRELGVIWPHMEVVFVSGGGEVRRQVPNVHAGKLPNHERDSTALHPLNRMNSFGPGSTGFEEAAVVEIPQELIAPGLKIAVDVYSPVYGDTVFIGRWPRDGWTEIDVIPVESLPSMEVKLVPVMPRNPDCDCHEWPDISVEALKTLVAEREDNIFGPLREWYPVQHVSYSWHDDPVLQGPGNGTVDGGALHAVAAKERVHGDGKTFWVGVCVRPGGCFGVGGMAYLGGRASISSLSGPTLAHEIGHNIGFRHPNPDGRAPMVASRTGYRRLLHSGTCSTKNPEVEHFRDWYFVDEPVPWESPVFMGTRGTRRYGGVFVNDVHTGELCAHQATSPWHWTVALAVLSGEQFPPRLSAEHRSIVVIN